MNLQSMEVLLAISQRKTVAGAARQLDVSRSSVRRRLDALETAVGATLAYRGQGTIRLTPAGRLLAERARGLIDAVEVAVQDTRAAATCADDVVRVIGPVGAPVDVRTQVLLELGERHPELRIELIDTERPLAHLDGDFDLLTYFGRPLDDELFVVRPFVRVRLCLMASPAYLERHGSPATVAALASHRLLVWRPAPDTFRGLPAPDGRPVLIRPAVETADMELVRELAAQGAGIAWCSAAAVSTADRGRRLVPVLADAVTTTLSGWLVCPRLDARPPQSKVVLDGIMQRIEPIELG